MPKGKLRSPEEINARIKELKRKHRPLLAELERLDIQARALDWAMGGDDTFVQPEAAESAEEVAEVSE